MTRKNIAIIGIEGQIGASLAGLLLDKDEVNIIGIGKQGSVKFDSMLRDGMRIHFRDPQNKILRFAPENSTGDRKHSHPSFLAFGCDLSDQTRIADSLEHIPGNIDYIIYCTKTFSHDMTLSNCIEFLNVHKSRDSKQTKIMPAHNGLSKLLINSIMESNTTMVPINFEDMHFVRDDFINRIYDKDSVLFKKNYLTCVLNIACQPYQERNGVSPELPYCEYDISTPFPNINIPIDHTFPTLISADQADDDMVHELRTIFHNAGMNLGTQPIATEVFKKLQVNMINGLCTLTGLKIGEVMEDPKASQIYFAMAQEVENTATKFVRLNVIDEESKRPETPSHATVKALRNEEQLRERLTYSQYHRTSTCIDCEQGKKLEIESLFDTIGKIANGCGIQLHVIPQISQALKKLESQRDSQMSEELARLGPNPDDAQRQAVLEHSIAFARSNFTLSSIKLVNTNDMEAPANERARSDNVFLMSSPSTIVMPQNDGFLPLTRHSTLPASTRL